MNFLIGKKIIRVAYVLIGSVGNRKQTILTPCCFNEHYRQWSNIGTTFKYCVLMEAKDLHWLNMISLLGSYHWLHDQYLLADSSDERLETILDVNVVSNTTPLPMVNF